MSKRAPKGQGMIRKRSEGSWQARLNVGYDPVTGKPIRKSIYGKTQSEVRKKLTALQKSIDTSEYISPTKMTVEKWCQIYYQKYTVNLKPSTKVTLQAMIRNHIVPAIGKTKIQQLKTEQIQSLYQSMLTSGIKASSLYTFHKMLHTVFNQAVKSDIIRKNPLDGCVLPKAEKKKLNIPDSEKLKQFVDIIKDTRTQDPLLFILFTGTRKDEACGLTWESIDFDHNIIKIEKQLYLEKGVGPVLISTKNDKTRILHPPKQAMDIIKRQKQIQEKWKQEFGSKYKNNLNLVFTQSDGYHIRSIIYKDFKQAVSAIGMPELRLHDLRHTYATISIMMGDDIKTVSENLGHSSVSFTLDTYGHVTDEMKNKSSMRLQSYIDSLGLNGTQDSNQD